MRALVAHLAWECVWHEARFMKWLVPAFKCVWHEARCSSSVCVHENKVHEVVPAFVFAPAVLLMLLVLQRPALQSAAATTAAAAALLLTLALVGETAVATRAWTIQHGRGRL